MKVVWISLVVFVLLNNKAFGQHDSLPENKNKHDLTIGFIANPLTLGVETEYKFYKNIGVRFIGTRILGYQRPNEYGYAGIGLITFSAPSDFKLLEPVIGFGCVYTLYHWDYKGFKGDITDLNIGGGFGTNFKFTDRFKAGINLFLANGYEAKFRNGINSITNRKMLIFPTLSIDFTL